MKKLLDYVPLHFAILIIVGIIIQYYFQLWDYGFITLLLLILIFSSSLLFIKNKLVATFLSFLTFFLVGVSSVFFNNSINYSNYYKNHLVENAKVTLRVTKILKPNIYTDKYEADVIRINDKITKGKILLNIKKDSLIKKLNVDELIVTKCNFKDLLPPLNPNQFDYKQYLSKQGIYQQIFLQKHQFALLPGYRKWTFLGLSARFRNKVQKSLIKHNFKDDELGVIKALLLGQRQDISKELVTDYQQAGAIHILAVSGLHVGVILLILSFLFKPIERFNKGKLIKAILIVIFLWLFAFIAGLSASVVRAVTMFTFLAFGQAFKRKNIITFSLISSFLFLLIIKPMFLFDVGFQLSYLAVFSIVWLQPKLYNCWSTKVKLIDYIWQLFTVSIAAQIGILPLSIYYFQQFPGLFLASNLVIIPFLMYILFGGLLVIFLSLLNILPQFLAETYGYVISSMNSFVTWVSSQQLFLIKELSLTFIMMITWYAFLFFGALFLINRKVKKLLYFLITILIVQSLFLFEKYQKENKKEFLLFHKSRKSIVGKRIGDKLFLNNNVDTLKLKDDFSLKNYRINEGIKEIIYVKPYNFINFSKIDILLIDSLGVYKVKGVKKPIVVLQHSPKINLKRLIKILKPRLIIVDGSNYKSYVNNWREVCEKQKTPFYFTGEKGAFILK